MTGYAHLVFRLPKCVFHEYPAQTLLCVNFVDLSEAKRESTLLLHETGKPRFNHWVAAWDQEAVRRFRSRERVVIPCGGRCYKIKGVGCMGRLLEQLRGLLPAALVGRWRFFFGACAVRALSRA